MSISFSFKNSSEGLTADLFSAIEQCKRQGETSLVFEKGVYRFDDRLAPEIPICVSNHGETGYRKTAFLLEDMEELVIDGGGSTFIFEGIMNAVTLLRCKGVTLKNFSIEFPDYPYPNGFVTNIGENFFDLRFDSDKVEAENGVLYVKSGEFSDRVHCDVRFDGKTHEIVHGTGDNSLGVNINTLNCKKLENGDFRFFDPPVLPAKTDVFGMLTGIRRASGILLCDSEDVKLENITIHSCIGIGIMAQLCKNVTVDGCKVTSSEGRYVSSAADATHFVACRGKITVKNSLFEHMLDDALNVHGIYTRITDSSSRYTLVKFMNSASVGIDLYRPGDKVAVLDPDSLKPIAVFTVEEAVMINREYIRLSFDVKAPLPVDCIIENVSAYPELLFENNIVRNNRARGMLIATNRRATVRGCTFHTSGSAIVLECDGKFWYESGAITYLKIENNIFDGCRYANWDSGVISVPEGKKPVDGFYYHGKIEIVSNVFKNCCDVDVYADNVTALIYKDNESTSSTLRLCRIGEAVLPDNVILK